MADLELASKSFPVEYGVGQQKLSQVRDIRGGSSGRYYATVINHTAAYGTITVSGCPFTPTKAVVRGSYSTAAGPSTSYGTYSGGSTNMITTAGGGDYASSTTNISILYDGAGTVVKRATFGAFTGSGCTITFSVSTVTANYMIELS
jgi:hypothetical protein